MARIKCNQDCFNCIYDDCILDEEDVIRIRKPLTDEQRERVNKNHRIQYELKKEKGICVKCANKATHGIYCYDCYIKKQQYNQAKRKGVNAFQLYREQGLCSRCGDKIYKGRLCKKHYDINIENLKKRKTDAFKKNNAYMFDKR